MGILRGRATLAAVAIVAASATAPAAAQAAFVKGSPGGGDPYFPKAGNGGYDVSHYNLHLRYRPRTNRLAARAAIDARAKKSLARFDLDFRRLRIERLTVNGERARYARRGQELKITPATRGRSPTRMAPRTAGSRPTTVRSSLVSRRARRPGFLATTCSPTRRPIASGSPCRGGGPRSRTAGSPTGTSTDTARPSSGTRTRRWQPIWRP